MSQTSSGNSSLFQTLSDGMATAAEQAGGFTAQVRGRRGIPASGIAIAGDLLVTAAHVLDPGRDDRVRVRTADADEVSAAVVGRDTTTDLALLRVPSVTLAAPNEAAGQPRVGSLALAVARPGQDVSVSLALISAIGGPTRARGGSLLERHYRVDTVMYPGFSGGPLVDANGGVLGLNTSGLSFSGQTVTIPWATVVTVTQALAEHGRVPRAYLGVGTQPVNLSPVARETAGGQEAGLLVLTLSPDAPASKAGLLQGDILVRLGDETVASADDLQLALGHVSPNAVLRLEFVRGGALRQLDVTVGGRP